MNVRLDKARDDEPPAEILARRVSAKPWPDAAKRPSLTPMSTSC